MSCKYPTWVRVFFRFEEAGTADPPPAKIRPQRVFQNVLDVEQEMATAKAHAQTFYTQAEAEGRGVREDELVIVEQHLEYHEWLASEEKPRMERFEKMRREEADRELKRNAGPAVARSQALATVPGGFHHAPAQPRVINTKLQAFRSQSFSGGAAEAEQAAHDSGHWLRAFLFGAKDSIDYCKRHDHLRLDKYDQAFDAQTVDDNIRGGVLVPEIVSQTIIDVRNRWGLLAQIARTYPMASETDRVPKRAAGLTVYKPGEEVAITTSEKTWGSVILTARDAYTLTHVSHKLMRGSVVSAADQVINEIGHAFAKQQDYEGFNGTGAAAAPDFGITGAVPGITGTGTAGILASGAASWAAITPADINQLIGLLPDRFHDMACFVCSRSFWAQVLEPMLENRGSSKDDIATSSTRSLKGYPVKFTEQMPTTFAAAAMPLLFGNFYEGILLGEREQVGIATSEHNRFEFDQLAIRGRMAYDIQFHETGDAVTPGAIVGLTT